MPNLSFADPQQSRGSLPRQNVRALVVDDYPDNAESMGLLLRLYGYDVDTANDGPVALRAAQVFQPDVVLLDISMPGMNGYKVARQLRQMFGGEVLLIAITAHGFEEDRRQCQEAGFDHYFVKPADPTEVQSLLATWLDAVTS